MDRSGRGWRRAILTTAVAAAAIIAAGAPLPAVATRPDRGAHAGAPADGLPKLFLIDQNGRAISLASLKGKPALVAFIHTRCEGPCEVITARMRQVARALGAGFNTEVTMVSITTEPAEDDASALLAYARAQGVDGAGWVFLTGGPAAIRRLLSLYGVLGEERDSDHVLEVFLLDADGAALRRYNGIATPAQTIAADIRRSAAPR